MIALKFIMKDLVNCWLSYTLSQPVEFDVAVMLYFLLQYIGVIQLTGLLKQVVPNLSVSVVSRFRKNSLEAVTIS